MHFHTSYLILGLFCLPHSTIIIYLIVSIGYKFPEDCDCVCLALFSTYWSALHIQRRYSINIFDLKKVNKQMLPSHKLDTLSSAQWAHFLSLSHMCARTCTHTRALAVSGQIPDHLRIHPQPQCLLIGGCLCLSDQGKLSWEEAGLFSGLFEGPMWVGLKRVIWTEEFCHLDGDPSILYCIN